MRKQTEAEIIFTMKSGELQIAICIGLIKKEKKRKKNDNCRRARMMKNRNEHCDDDDNDNNEGMILIIFYLSANQKYCFKNKKNHAEDQ